MQHLQNSIASIDEHKRFGVYCGFSKNKHIRDNASSGGICGEIAANAILKTNASVVGASYTNAFDDVCFIAVDTLEKYIEKIARSKYLESDITQSYSIIQDQLSKNKDILVIACPCQIKAVLEKFNYNPHIFSVDFICHGCSQKKIFKQQIMDIDCNIANINMRPNHTKCLVITDKAGKNIILPSAVKHLLDKNNFIERCKTCKINHGNGNYSDITVGDFWQFRKNVHPDKFNPINGVSFIKINTEKGN